MTLQYHHPLPSCFRVGNGLGAGSAALAKRTALAAAITVPSFWSVFALVLTVPASQRAVIGLFTNESDGELLGKMQHLLRLLAVMLLFDMSQGGELGLEAWPMLSRARAEMAWMRSAGGIGPPRALSLA